MRKSKSRLNLAIYDPPRVSGPELILSNGLVENVAGVCVQLGNIPEKLRFLIGEQAIFPHAAGIVTIISHPHLCQSYGKRSYYYEVRGRFPEDKSFERFFALAASLQPTVSTLIVRALREVSDGSA